MALGAVLSDPASLSDLGPFLVALLAERCQQNCPIIIGEPVCKNRTPESTEAPTASALGIVGRLIPCAHDLLHHVERTPTDRSPLRRRESVAVSVVRT